MKKKKIPFSKLVVSFIILLAFVFVIFICYEMDKLGDLSPVAYVGTGIVLLLALTVRAYMKRAYQTDLVNLKISQAKELSELKKNYGEDFTKDDIEDVTIDN